MKKEDLIVKTNEALAEEFEIEVADIDSDGDIKETLDLDSLSLVDMVALIESMYGVKIQGQEIVNIKTFQNLYDFVFDRMKN